MSTNLEINPKLFETFIEILESLIVMSLHEFHLDDIGRYSLSGVVKLNLVCKILMRSRESGLVWSASSSLRRAKDMMHLATQQLYLVIVLCLLFSYLFDSPFQIFKLIFL